MTEQIVAAGLAGVVTLVGGGLFLRHLKKKRAVGGAASWEKAREEGLKQQAANQAKDKPK